LQRVKQSGKVLLTISAQQDSPRTPPVPVLWQHSELQLESREMDGAGCDTALTTSDNVWPPDRRGLYCTVTWFSWKKHRKSRL